MLSAESDPEVPKLRPDRALSQRRSPRTSDRPGRPPPVCYALLSYAEVSEWLAERGILVDQSTIYRWVQRFLPLFGEAAGQYGSQ